MERVAEQGTAGLATEHLHTEKFSDNSEAELDCIGLITIERSKRIQNRKRKRSNQTDVSCSSLSSGAGSPLNLPCYLGFIGKTGFESNDENSDGSRSRSSRSRSHSGLPGYQSATTAVVTDSEDDFPIDLTDVDRFSVEYEPPETNSEDENDDDYSDIEEIVFIPSSSEDEDPGAEGGDEDNLDSDSEDSWECSECWTMNHPMTIKCLMCWKKRSQPVQQLIRVPAQLADLSSTTISKQTEITTACATSTIDEATTATNILLEKNISISLSRSSSSCSSSTQTSCDSGICVSSCETDTELHKRVTETNMNTVCRTMSSISQLAEVNSSGITDSAVENSNTFNETLEQKGNTLTLNKDTLTLNDNTSLAKKEDGLTQKEDIATQKEDASNLCVVCSTEPRNASIIHGRSGHQVCCITCAEKLKADKKRCPVCRKKIQLVVKNFL